MKKKKYTKSIIGLSLVAILFFGGYLLASSFPSVGSLAMRVMPDKLTAAISINLCRATVTIDAKAQRPGNPICVKKPVWCTGSPTIVAKSGYWANGSPGWGGNPPLYGLSYNGIGLNNNAVCPNLTTTGTTYFPNGGLRFWFYEPQDTAAIYADNTGSRTFNVTWPSAKAAALLVTSPMSGDAVVSGQNLTVNWQGTPPEAFSSYEVSVGGVKYKVGTKTTYTYRVYNPYENSTESVIITGYLKSGYVCTMDGVISNTVCVASVKLRVRQ